MISEHQRVTENATGRTGVTMRPQVPARVTERGVALPSSVLVAWDDAASYPRNVRPGRLTVTGTASSDEVVVYDPSSPSRHGKKIGDLAG